jgi:hypothetical protein
VKQNWLIDLDPTFLVKLKPLGLTVFFRRGHTITLLKDAGTEHSLNDVFTMLVMTVARLSRHDFNNDVGRGSSSQDYTIRVGFRTKTVLCFLQTNWRNIQAS